LKIENKFSLDFLKNEVASHKIPLKIISHAYFYRLENILTHLILKRRKHHHSKRIVVFSNFVNSVTERAESIEKDKNTRFSI
jgi:hypothetical protein